MTQSPFNFQNVVSFEDLKKGFEKLKKKKKYRDIYDPSSLSRYVDSSDREPNRLKLFLESFKEDSDGSSQEKLQKYFAELIEYRLDPFNALSIEKGKNTGKYRPLLVPTPKDRLLFDSLHRVVFDTFKELLMQRRLLGLGLTKKQKISDIILKVYTAYILKGYCYVLMLDYSAFFSRIDRDTLLQKMKNDQINENIIAAIMLIVGNSIQNGLNVERKTGVPITKNGIPQGLSFSPLLASYYVLDIDDIYMADNEVVGFRYIDDIIILGKSREKLGSIFDKIKTKSDELKMELHKIGEKSQLKFLKEEKFTYLGVDISCSGIEINEEKFVEFMEIIKNDIFSIKARKKYKGDEIKKIKRVYYSFITGWLNHYEKISDDSVKLHERLDGLIKKYFNSGKNGKIKKKFFDRNPWIRISGNRAIVN